VAKPPNCATYALRFGMFTMFTSLDVGLGASPCKWESRTWVNPNQLTELAGVHLNGHAAQMMLFGENLLCRTLTWKSDGIQNAMV